MGRRPSQNLLACARVKCLQIGLSGEVRVDIGARLLGTLHSRRSDSASLILAEWPGADATLREQGPERLACDPHGHRTPLVLAVEA